MPTPESHPGLVAYPEDLLENSTVIEGSVGLPEPTEVLDDSPILDADVGIQVAPPSKTALARRAARVPPRITLTVLANGYAWEPAPLRRRAFIEYDTKAKGWSWELSPPRAANRQEGMRYGRTRSGTCKYLHQALGKIAARMNNEPTSAVQESPIPG